ncbi:MAG: hypothetical protein U0R78_03325 [Nocardioidaceae bacterium]
MTGPTTGPGPCAVRLLGQSLVQPDNTSCGAASLVVAQAVLDDAYAELLVDGVHPGTGFASSGGSAVDRFRQETLAMHRRVTGLVAVSGRLQLPWPAAFGTPPWAVANQLSARGTPYGTHVVRTSPESAYTLALPALERQVPVAFYVGDGWLPRHVVLGLGTAPHESLRIYDPAIGGVRVVTREAFASRALPFGRWSQAWFVVTPR